MKTEDRLLISLHYYVTARGTSVGKQLQVEDFFECIGYHAITRVICTVHEWNECTADYENCTGILYARENRDEQCLPHVCLCAVSIVTSMGLIAWQGCVY